MSIRLGATVRTTFTTDLAETGTLTVTRPDGTVVIASVTGEAGNQAALFEADQAGEWTALWESDSSGQYVETFRVGVDTGVTLDHVKAALNKTNSNDDEELQRILDAALAEYEEFVGPLPGPATQSSATGGVIVLRSSRAASVQSVTSTYGAAQTFTLADGGVLSTGYGPVVISYTVGPLPLNHVQTIIADVAGLFAATQRGGGATAPRFPGEGYAEPLSQPGRPVVLFPRIRALAPMGIA